MGAGSGVERPKEVQRSKTSLGFFLLHPGLHINHDITKIDNMYIYTIMTR